MCFAVLGLFNLVQFANSACNATDGDRSSGRTGVCFTGSECEAKGGRAGGVCAAGFGVCCICKGLSLSAIFPTAYVSNFAYT